MDQAFFSITSKLLSYKNGVQSEIGITFWEIYAREKRKIGIKSIAMTILNSLLLIVFEKATSKNGIIGKE